MKILVPVKRVVDPCVALQVRPDGSGMDTASVRMCMNPFDEIAVEAAVRFREAGVATEVVAVSCGVNACQETLRTAMAMGADRGILVETAADLWPLVVARLLEAVCSRERPDLVICGKQAVDDDACQVGQMLAALVGWPQATYASQVVFADGKLRVTREIDGGREIVQMGLPAVITTELGLNEPRYVTLPNLMKARKKPLAVLMPEDLGVTVTPRLEIVRVAEPSGRAASVRVADVDELVTRLRNEAKVI